MALRDKLNANPGIAAAAALLGIIFTAVVLWWWYGTGGTSSEGRAYYYDLGTNARFVAPATAIPPIERASGPENGVEAAVFACGDCGSGGKVLYLTRYTPEGKQAAALMAQGKYDTDDGRPMGEVLSENLQIRDIDGTTWVAAGSPAGVNIINKAQRSCGSVEQTVRCYPAADE